MLVEMYLFNNNKIFGGKSVEKSAAWCLHMEISKRSDALCRVWCDVEVVYKERDWL
jgi:hypothetical protein